MRHPVAWLRARPLLADALLAGIVATLGVLAHLLLDRMDGEQLAAPSAMGVVLCLGATVPLAWRRRAPLLVLPVVTGCQWILEIMNAGGPGWLGVLIAAYSLGAYHLTPRRWWVAGAFIAAVTLFVVGAALHGKAAWSAVASTLIILPAAVVFGDSVRQRRKRLADLSERAERAELEREMITHRHVQDERARIARELHDVVAHSVSVMVIQAGAARRLLSASPEQPDRAVAALENIETTGRSAMQEMRRILGVLRDDSSTDGPARAPTPSIGQIGDLVQTDPDLHVDLSIDEGLDDVPSGVGVHVFRLVQEALTNVRRHAGRVDHVVVRLRRDGGTLDLEIVDDGRGASTLAHGTQAPHDQGHGLIGMRERAMSVGGDFQAGPRAGGGWRVHARLPIDRAADEVRSS